MTSSVTSWGIGIFYVILGLILSFSLGRDSLLFFVLAIVSWIFAIITLIGIDTSFKEMTPPLIKWFLRYSWSLLFLGLFIIVIILIGMLAAGNNFSNFLIFMKDNNGILQTLASIILAIITFFYMILTRDLVDEQRKMRESQSEPHISIFIQPREEWINAIDMIIQNLGNGPALNIKFSLNPEFEHKKGHKLSHLGFFKNGIPYLDSKQKIRFPLTIITENPQEKMKTKFDIAVSYEDISGRKNEKIIPIDFTQFEGLTQLGVPPEYKIAREIEKMQSDIHSIINGKEIRVIRYTKEDDEEEKQKEREELKQLNEKHDQIKG